MSKLAEFKCMQTTSKLLLQHGGADGIVSIAPAQAGSRENLEVLATFVETDEAAKVAVSGMGVSEEMLLNGLATLRGRVAGGHSCGDCENHKRHISCVSGSPRQRRRDG